MGIFLRSDRGRVFDQDFKSEAVKQVFAKRYSNQKEKEVAKELGIDRRTLRDWMNSAWGRALWRQLSEAEAQRRREWEQMPREWREHRGS